MRIGLAEDGLSRPSPPLEVLRECPSGRMGGGPSEMRFRCAGGAPIVVVGEWGPPFPLTTTSENARMESAGGVIATVISVSSWLDVRRWIC